MTRKSIVKQGEKGMVEGGIEVKESTLTVPALAHSPAIEADVSRQTALVVAVKAKATDLVIHDAPSCVLANEMLLQLQAAKKALEERKAFFVKPLKDHVKRIEALYTKPLKQLASADEQLRAKVLDYRKAEQAKVDAERRRREEELAEAQRKAEEAQRKAEKSNRKATAAKAEAATDAVNEAALAVLATPTQARVIHTEIGQVATRKVWDFEVVDKALVPDQYWELDERAIRMAVTSGLRNIPGVRIFQKESLTVGGK